MDVVHQNDHADKRRESYMNFEKPEYKITEYVENNNYGKFELEPLEIVF